MYFNEKRQGLAPFVNLRSDVGFKAVFADRNNKDILIGVLNQILPPEARIEDIKEYSDREQRRDVPYGKKTVLDLVCVDRDDRTFVVEMQASEEDFFFERCVSSTTRRDSTISSSRTECGTRDCGRSTWCRS